MGDNSSCRAELEGLHRVFTRYLLLITLCYVVASLLVSDPHMAAALLLRRPATDCRSPRNTTEIVFLALYPPCSNEARSSSELVRLEQCDLLTETAIDLAVERINQNPNILPESATLRVIPVRFEDEDSANADDKMIMVSHQY